MSKFPSKIKSEGHYVLLSPIDGHPAYGAGDDGFVYSFYEFPGSFDYLNMPRKLVRFTLGKNKRSGYALESPDTYYDAATLIANAWNILGDGDIIGMKDSNNENLRPCNLEWMGRGEYLRHMKYIRFGEKNGSSKLSKHDVLFIREQRGITKMNDIAAIFCVHPSTIKQIWGGKKWTHLGPLPSERDVACKMWAYRPRHNLTCSVCKTNYIGPADSFRRHKKGLDVCCTIHCRQVRAAAIKYGNWATK